MNIKLETLLPDIVLKNPQDAIIRSVRSNFKKLDPNKLKLAHLDKDTFAKNKVSSKGIVYRLDEMTGLDKIYNSSETYFFRNDLDWGNLGKFLREKYNKDKKVNIYQFAPSTGKESYTFVITVMNEFKDEATKFLPIKSYDINHSIVESAKKLQKSNFDEQISEYEVREGLFNMGLKDQDVDEYFECTKNPFALGLKSKVSEAVTFNHANILDEWQNIDEKNPSIIVCRNMWPYVDDKEHELISKNLYNKLAKNSCIIIGGFDNLALSWVHIAKRLKSVGFIPSGKCMTKYSNGNIIFEK